jgi:amino acid transporter
MILHKVNINQILRNHFATLRNDNSQKAEFDDYLTFLIIPLATASGLVYFNICLTESAVNIAITTLSILVGLLFNVIVLIFDIIKRDASQRLKNTVLKQLLANISFTILLSIITIVFTLVTFITEPKIKVSATWIVYFLLTVFLFTVLMVLKRMYALFKNEIEEIEKSEKKP